MVETKDNIYIDLKKLSDAIKHWCRAHNVKVYNALESAGLNHNFLMWCRRYAAGPDDLGRTPNLWSIQRAVKYFHLRPSRFIYFSDRKRDPQPLDPENDFYIDDEEYRLLEVSPISKKIIESVQEQRDTELLGPKLASVTWDEVDTLDRLISLTLHIANTFKSKFPMISVEHIMNINPDLLPHQNFIIVRCQIIDDVALDFKFKLSDPDVSSKFALGCIDVKNNLIDERHLSNAAFSKVDQNTVIDYLTLLKRETTIFRRI